MYENEEPQSRYVYQTIPPELPSQLKNTGGLLATLDESSTRRWASGSTYREPLYLGELESAIARAAGLEGSGRRTETMNKGRTYASC